MKTCLDNPAYYLVSPKELLQKDIISQLPQSDLEALNKVLGWARNFLCKSNSELGREGPVCPFAKPSIHKNLFWLTVYRDKDITLEKAFNAVIHYRNWFVELEPTESNEAQYKTILILFPDVAKEDAPKVVDKLQQMLKMDFVSVGLMIGQFHELCQEGGLWNPDFRPLRSPVPMLAIRQMVPSDFAFLKHEPAFIMSYLDRFAVNLPPQVRELFAKAVCQV